MYIFRSGTSTDIMLGKICIFVKTVYGKNITIQICLSETVERIKHIVYITEGVPPLNQMLLVADRVMENGHKLSDYKINEGATIHLLIKIMGGSDSEANCGMNNESNLPISDCENSDVELLLYVGTILRSVDEAKRLVTQYCDKKYARLIVLKNDKKTLYFACTNQRYRKSRSEGKRVRNHHSYTGCQAGIRFSKRKDGSLKLISFEENHNHPLHKEIYESKTLKLSKDELQFVKLLSDSNVNSQEISRLVEEKFKKKITPKKVRNLVAVDDEDEEIADLVTEIREGGGTCNWEKSDDGGVTAMYVSSKYMKKQFVKVNPPLIQIDTTFHVEQNNYKLCGFCYLDPHTDKSNLAGLGLMEAETCENFEYTFREIQRDMGGGREDIIFIIDKDFKEEDTLRKVFPFCVILYCRFHVIKYMKSIVATALIPVHEKHPIIARFVLIVYSKSKDDFDLKCKAFMTEIEGVKVLPPGNNQMVLLSDYFVRRWQSCSKMWVEYERRHLNTMGDNTNNRIERMFGTLKSALKERYKSLQKPETTIIFIVRYLEKKDRERRFITDAKKLRIYSKDLEIKQSNEEASFVINTRGCILFNKAQVKAKESELAVDLDRGVVIETINGVNYIYSSTELTCNCSSYRNNQMVCKHIIVLRKEKGLSTFSPDIFGSCWFRNEAIELDLATKESLEVDNILIDNSDAEADLSKVIEDAEFCIRLDCMEQSTNSVNVKNVNSAAHSLDTSINKVSNTYLYLIIVAFKQDQNNKELESCDRIEIEAVAGSTSTNFYGSELKHKSSVKEGEQMSTSAVVHIKPSIVSSLSSAHKLILPTTSPMIHQSQTVVCDINQNISSVGRSLVSNMSCFKLSPNIDPILQGCEQVKKLSVCDSVDNIVGETKEDTSPTFPNIIELPIKNIDPEHDIEEHSNNNPVKIKSVDRLQMNEVLPKQPCLSTSDMEVVQETVMDQDSMQTKSEENVKRLVFNHNN